MQRKKQIFTCKKKRVLKPIFLTHIYRYIYIKAQRKKFNTYKGLMAWRIKLNTGTMSYIVIKML